MLTLLCSMGVWAQSYKLVESEPSDWSGKYLLVAVNNSNYYAWNGTFGSWGTCVAIQENEISNDKKNITPSSTSTMTPMTINAVDDGYTLQSGDNYLASTDKKFNSANSPVVFSYFALDDDSKVVIQKTNTGSNDYGIRYNHNNGSGGFRVYKTQTTAEGFYLYKEQSDKISSSLSFATGSPFTVNIGESFTAPTLSATPSSILSSVTFSSSNTSVAEVNAISGAVTIKGLGSATITASYVGDNTYSSSKATYVINVVDPNIINATFDLSSNQYGWGTTNDGSVYFDGATYTPATEGDITLSVAGNVRMWGSTESSLRLYGENVGTAPNIYTYGKGSITFKAAEGYIITGITFEGSSLTFVPNVGTYASSAWTGLANEVELEKGSNTPQIKKIIVTYRESKDFSLTIGSSNWASMYLDFAAKVPESATAYYASKVENDIITLKPVKTGEILPANTGVIVNGSSCTFTESTETPATVTGNLFEGVTKATPCEARTVWVLNTTSTATLGDPVLSLYTGTLLGANKAYLPASKVAGAKTLKLVVDDNEATGINSATTVKATGVAFNLAGQRVAPNAKGIVIVNGKKIINK